MQDAASRAADGAAASSGEVNALRETIALLREQLDQKEAELEARRREMQQLLEGHQQEVQQLHVLLLQQGPRGALPRPVPATLPELPGASADGTVGASGETATAAPPVVLESAPVPPAPPVPTSSGAPAGPDVTALVGSALGILAASSSTRYEPLTLQQLAQAAGLDVATTWRYRETFADYLITTNTAGNAPAGPIWSPINAALLRVIDMMYKAGAATESIAEMLATAQREKPEILLPGNNELAAPAAVEGKPGEEPAAPPPPEAPRRPWWQHLLRW